MLQETDFVGGVAAVVVLKAKEKQIREEASRIGKIKASDNSKEGEAAYYRALNVLKNTGGPVWQQVCGFSPKRELSIDLSERRAGIRRLLRVVERMFRDELKAADVDRDGGPSNLMGGEASFAGRSVAWEPLHEICVYLEISKAQLNAFSLQRTGLKVIEICDCIRVEGMRTSLRDKFRPLVKAWVEKKEKDGSKNSIKDDLVNAAWQFLKWMRGGGRCETRKKMALELGMTSRERLDRAVMVSERDTLEAIEVAVAMLVIEEAMGTPHGAGCDEVCDEVGDAGAKEGEVRITEDEVRGEAERGGSSAEAG